MIAHAKEQKDSGLGIHGDAAHKVGGLAVMKWIAKANNVPSDIDSCQFLDLAEILLKCLV